MPEGLSAGRLYYELGWQVEKAVAGAATFEATGNRISQAASKATTEWEQFLSSAARSPQTLRDAGQAVDQVTAGMSRAGQASATWDRSLRLLAQQEAATRLEADRLARPLDTIAAGMTRASLASRDLITGMSRAGQEAASTAGQTARLGAAGTEASKGANKIQSALVGLAIQGTQTSGAVGKVIEGLLLLGAGSLAVTGAAAGIALLTAAWHAYTAKQREARQAQDALMTRLREGIETPVSKATAELKAATKAVDEFRAALAKPATVEPSGLIVGGLAPAVTVPRPAGPRQVTDDERDRLNQLLIAQNRARVALAQAQDEAGTAAAAFEQDLVEAAAKATKTLVDDLLVVLDRFKAKYADVAAGLSDTGRRLAEAAIAKLENEIRVIRKGESLTSGLTPALADTQGRGKLPLRQDAEGLAKATKAAADQAKRFKDEQEAADHRIQQARDHVREQADAIERAVRSALQLGEAFGLVDEKVGQALEGIAQVGAELKVVAANGLSFASALTIAGGIASILGGLFGGESDRDRKDREARDANTRALHELTKAFTTQVSGADVGQARSAVDALLARGTLKRKGDPDFADILDVGKVKRTLAELGLSFEDFEDILKDINPNFKLNTSSAEGFVESLKQIRRGLDEINFRAFAESFAGQLALLQDQWDLMDLSNPMEQLRQLAQLGAQQSPFLKELSAGLDLSTQAGRDEFERRVIEAFKRLNLDSAHGGFTAEELGNMSSEEFREWLKAVEEWIDRVNEDQGTATGGGPLRQTSGDIPRITEARGSELAGLLTSIDTRLVEGVNVSKEIRDLLARLVGPATFIPPPALPGSMTAAGLSGAGLFVTFGPGSVQVSIAGAATEGQLRQAGELLGGSLARSLAAELGRQTSSRTTWLGTQGH